MRKGDWIWGALLIGAIAVIATPWTHEWFLTATAAHPYVSGFIKFALLATMGEMLVVRLRDGAWRRAPGFVQRIAIWGFLGMTITLMFSVFSGGVLSALERGLLPGKGQALAFAFFTSALMNLTFAPTMMAFHRFTDTYLDLKYGCGEAAARPSVKAVVDAIDWQGFVGVVLFKTVPFFWIPAHTVTFLFPPAYRVLAAAFLSMALGLLLTLSKGKPPKHSE